MAEIRLCSAKGLIHEPLFARRESFGEKEPVPPRKPDARCRRPRAWLCSLARARRGRLDPSLDPHSGEKLPTVGLVPRAFSTSARMRRSAAELEGVVSALVAGGGSVIDTSSDYGSAEAVVGDLVQKLGVRQQVFIADKIRSDDAKTAHAEFERGLKRLKTDSVDLLQLHNVSRADESLAQLRDWKAMKLCRYIGVTSTYEGDYDAMETIIPRETPDFVQVAYSLGQREKAEKRILPAAAEAARHPYRAPLRTKQPFPRGEGQAAPRLGERLRRGELGAALPQIPYRQ